MNSRSLTVLKMAFPKVFLSRLLTIFIVFAMVSTSIVTDANARFISPDDWDPVVQGVGTNRYSYAENDPINKSDPNGHAAVAAGGGGFWSSIGKAIGGFFSGGGGAAGALGKGIGFGVSGAVGLGFGAGLALALSPAQMGNGEMRADARENTQGMITLKSEDASEEDKDKDKDKKSEDGQQYGSYTHTHASGKVYHGKGRSGRPAESAKEVEKRTKDPHVSTDWTDAENEREAFKQESRRLGEKGHLRDDNYNRIESPGLKYRKQDGEID
jgi:hypothetical protein